MNSDVKFVFFDMGKVLLEFDHQRLIKQVAALTETPASEMEEILFHAPHNLENRFEVGDLNGDQFHRSLCEVTASDVDKDALMLAVADIFWLNTSIVHVVTQLRGANFPIGVLSNTCEAHWEFVKANFAVINLFDHRVLSYEENSMKPDGKIYQSAIEMANRLTGCEAKEIFFVDDKKENVDAARDAGINAELYESTRELSIQLRAARILNVG